ncbi:hypothetical protein B5E65_00750 [Gemmiger sp. An120]|nr:hypothetical protein B5E65_00750 [Gemmiger sp. An120]
MNFKRKGAGFLMGNQPLRFLIRLFLFIMEFQLQKEPGAHHKVSTGFFMLYTPLFSGRSS